MNKTEANLIKAIENGNYDESVKALNAFQDLQDSTDIECNKYYVQVEGLKNPEEKEEEAPEEKKEEVVVANLSTMTFDELKELTLKCGLKVHPKAKEQGLIKNLLKSNPDFKNETPKIQALSSLDTPTEIPVETRGRKKEHTIERQHVIKKFNEFMEALVNFQAQEKAIRGVNSRWASRSVKRFNVLKKQLFR